MSKGCMKCPFLIALLVCLLPAWLTFRGNDLSLAELSNLHTLISAHLAAALAG